MPTRGQYGIVKDDHFYGAYQHTLMYPAGHPCNLLREAADISRSGDWDAVIQGWVSKEWADRTGHLASRFENVVYREADGNRPDAPSWRAAAEQPLLPKEQFGGWDHEWAIVVDADSNEIVVFDMGLDADGPPVRAVAAISLDDPDTMEDTADAFNQQVSRSPHGSMPPVATQRDWAFRTSPIGPRSYNTRVTSSVRDGQWKHPAHIDDFDNQPDDYPAKHYPTWDKPGWAVECQEAAGGDDLVYLAAQAATSGNPTVKNARCSHVGLRSRKQCIRPSHTGRNHRYQ